MNIPRECYMASEGKVQIQNESTEIYEIESVDIVSNYKGRTNITRIRQKGMLKISEINRNEIVNYLKSQLFTAEIGANIMQIIDTLNKLEVIPEKEEITKE